MGTYTNYARVDAVNNEIFSQGNSGFGVLTFSRTASGNVAPSRDITGASTGITNVGGFLPDLANNRLMVVDRTDNSIRVFARTATGNISPLMTLSGAGTGLSSPFGIDMDSTGGFTGIGPAQQQASVPTMTEWGMIIFMLLAGCGAFYYLRKKRA